MGSKTAQIHRQPDTDYLRWLKANIPASWTVDAPHIKLIAEHLNAVKRGDIDRLAIHMPPRHGKSEMTTIRFPVWWLRDNPTSNALLTGYNERFARKLGRKARNVARTVLHMDSEKQAADEWALMEGGLLMTRGVGSPPTGTGFGLITIDDPIRRREDAESEVYREKVWDWYTDDLYSRLEPGGAIVLVMTLWHEDDIGARAIASEPGRWTVLKLPALAESGDLLGRDLGTALWPDRWNVEQLERIKGVMSQNEGLRSWEALYQQNPTPREGSFFKVGQLKVVGAAPAGLRQCRAWDMAATEGDGDYTAGVKIGGPDADGIWYVLDVVRGRWSTDERNRMIRQTAALDGVKCRIRGPQDPGSAGKDTATAFKRMLAGFTVTTHPVSGTKENRADPWSAQVNAGNFRLVAGSWNKDFIEELRTFPGGKHDDQVDAGADAFTELTQRRTLAAT